MTRPCLCGLRRPWRLFGFTAREAVGGAPSSGTVSVDRGGNGLPPTFTRPVLLAGVCMIQGGEIVIRKFETEFTAGKPLADVCTLTDTALGMYAEEKGYVAPIATPNEARLDPAFKRQSPAILPTGGFCLVIAYNNKMIKPEQAPKGYLDLADPRFKGQVLFGAVGVEHEAINCVDCHATKTMQTGAGLGKGLSNKDGKTYWMNDITSHLFDVPRKTNKALKGVEPGKAMPIPYINACGACHDADNL